MCCMNRLWVDMSLGSQVVQGKVSVFLLIQKNLQCQIMEEYSDTNGRLIKAQISTPASDISLYTVYGPNDLNT